MLTGIPNEKLFIRVCMKIFYMVTIDLYKEYYYI